jgi:NtrC-family two-component system response regulator AlgB
VRILIVDDEKNIRMTLTAALQAQGHETTSVADGASALREVKADGFDAVLLDLRLSQESGLDLLDEIVRLSPRVAVILMTAYASIETAVEALRRGAVDYLIKPATPDQLRQVMTRLEKTKNLENRVAELESQLSAETPEANLSTRSAAMQRCFETAFKAAESDATLLLIGESGTGKGVLARAIHERSKRRSNAFVTVSCPSLSRELLESELFGHVKGAFTGAVAETWGKVAAADGGTLFLDEIGDLPSEIQAKLLRLLQEREYERVGETRPHKANVRIIAATNRDLRKAVSEGKFREDLFYRLNVISISLPSLRERTNDIAQLAKGYLNFFAAHAGKSVTAISSEAMNALQNYAWPGNLRELRNVIERAVILTSSNEIKVTDLAEGMEPNSELQLGHNATLEQIENEHIKKVVANAGSLEEAAKILGIDPATLYRRRKKL